MNWILHIGTQKTGSKAIQKFLVDNSKFLFEKNILFPVAGREGVWHKPIYNELILGMSQKLSMAIQEGVKSNADLGVISYEKLYELTVPQIELLYNVLGPAKVVLYIRRQDQLINSILNQLIKAHRVNYEYICNFESKLLEYNLNFDHMATIKRWSGIFGSDNVMPIIYNKKTSSIETFFSRLGVKDVVNSEAYLRNNPNPALDLAALEILKIVKKLNKKDEDLPHLVTTAHRVLRNSFIDTYIFGDLNSLSEFQKKAILEKYRSSNSELKEKYFPNMESIFIEPDFCEAKTSNNSINMDTVYTIFHEAGILYINDK